MFKTAGSMIAFAGLSSRPELNNKIRMFVGLAPVARVGNVNVPILHVLAPLADILLVFIQQDVLLQAIEIIM